MTMAQAKSTLDSILASIAEGVKTDGIVMIPGFGSFKVGEREERKGFNPSTKEPIVIPAKRFVKFTPGKSMEL